MPHRLVKPRNAISVTAGICIALSLAMAAWWWLCATRTTGMRDGGLKRTALELLRSRNEGERRLAITMLANPRHQASSVAPVAQLLETEPSEAVREYAAFSLCMAAGVWGRISEEDKLLVLRALLRAMTEDPSPKVRATVAFWLPGVLASWKEEGSASFVARVRLTALPRLRRALRDVEEQVREGAAEALKAVGQG